MGESELESGLAAAAVTDVGQLSPEDRARFAERVARTLEAVFNLDRTDALERARVYFDDGDIPPSLFTYHLSPLQIAADLASAHDGPLSDDELRRYRLMVDSSQSSENPRPADRLPHRR